MKSLIILTICVISFQNIYPQINDNETQELAFEYFRNKEYAKASNLFLELYNKKQSFYFFSYYIHCLIQDGLFEEAEKAIKKEIKKNNNDLSFKILLAYVYKLTNRTEDAQKLQNDVLKSLGPDLSQIFQVANMFIAYQEYSMAEATYLKGRKLVKNNYTFHLELANLYQIQKLFDKMIDEYFALLKENPSMIQTVQNRLQQSVYNSEDKSLIQLLQQKLIAQIQNEPDAVIFSEFLIWLYLQQNMFLQALNYAVSLDKRFKEDGSRIYSIGQMALSAKDYQTALKAFKYVIDKGSQSSWYFEAKSDYLLTLYYQVIDDKFYNKNKLIELETEFSNYLNQVGLNKYTFSIARILAQIKAFYLNKSDEAIEILNQIIKSNDFSQQQKNEVKLLLGDIMLMNDEIWEATLLYTQVEKGSFDDPLSHEAKYKKALLAYYTGDYLWAKAQTDILKASTSKLIANDAFNLSQFISDNIEIDTTYKSLRLFANSDFYVFKMQDSIAILFLDTLLMNPNFYELHDYALLKKADIYTRIKKLNKAIEIYDTILVHFDKKITAPQAAYKMANIYQYNLKNKDMAMKYLELLFNKYPESFYSNEARKRYRILRGDIIDETNNFEINF